MEKYQCLGLTENESRAFSNKNNGALFRLLNMIVPSVREELNRWLTTPTLKHDGKRIILKEVGELNDKQKDAISWTTVWFLLSNCSFAGPDVLSTKQTYTKLCCMLGEEIEDYLWIDRFENTETQWQGKPTTYKKYIASIRENVKTKQLWAKRDILKKAAETKNIPKLKWSAKNGGDVYNTTIFKVGAFLVNLCLGAQVEDQFVFEVTKHTPDGAKWSTNFIVITEYWSVRLDEERNYLLAQRARKAEANTPRPWSIGNDEGLMKLRDSYNIWQFDLEEQLWKSDAIKANNIVSRVPFEISSDLLPVYEQYAGTGEAKLGDFDEYGNEYAVNSKTILKLAKHYTDKKAIYFPHQFCFRGRMYPIGANLNPLVKKSSRALLRFKNSQSLDEFGFFWLCIGLANAYGEDKLSLRDRFNWAIDNADKIIGAAENERDEGKLADFWKSADEPWCFLELAKVFRHIIMEDSDYPCHTPIYLDCSNSAHQNRSMMSGDVLSAEMTNLIKGNPSEPPNDFYTLIADKINDYLKRDLNSSDELIRHMASLWYGKMNRKVNKTPTMSSIYGATAIGQRQQITKFLTNYKKDYGEDYFEDSTQDYPASVYMRELINEAHNECIPGMNKLLGWFRMVAKKFTDKNLPIIWITPAGFPVVQVPFKKNVKRVETLCGDGIVKQSLMKQVGEYTKDKIDGKKNSNSLAADVIHSYDQAWLCLTVVRCYEAGINNISVRHDSIGVLPNDVNLMRRIAWQVFREIYSVDVLEDLRDQWVAQLDEYIPPFEMDGDITLPESSIYFMS